MPLVLTAEEETAVAAKIEEIEEDFSAKMRIQLLTSQYHPMNNLAAKRLAILRRLASLGYGQRNLIDRGQDVAILEEIIWIRIYLQLRETAFSQHEMLHGQLEGRLPNNFFDITFNDALITRYEEEQMAGRIREPPNALSGDDGDARADVWGRFCRDFQHLVGLHMSWREKRNYKPLVNCC